MFRVGRSGRDIAMEREEYDDYNPITAALPGTRRSARLKDRGAMVDDTLGSYILMDHCRFGTLHDQLLKAAVDQDPNHTERWLPEPVLWRIFDCLVKACMAMQCPPRYVPANAPQPPAAAPGAAAAQPPWPTSLSAGWLPEVVAPGNGANAGHYGIVHGDLDPTNGLPTSMDASVDGTVGPTSADHVRSREVYFCFQCVAYWTGRMTSAEPQAPVPLPAHQERWTYGWSLLDPSEQWVTQYQPALTDLVAQCLMAKQEFRPTLQQIQTIIIQQLAVQANTDVPAYWTDTFFRQPPRPRAPEDTEFAARINPFWDYDDDVQDWLGRP
ncbi:hypothetical protein DHEL01_v200328 [Diaporthe helianthi]|uniref:Protein kinase domain-containing protein n=1 Tax=Diaporthe helianthi TaxID=158607 RepID=A0A2P5IFK1_DIAHE|nr:hypothetical protein DHEL01_v200328 [Diaporthe helianthi]